MTSGESRRIAFDGTILRGTVGSAMKLTFDEVRDLIDESETALVRAHAQTALPERPDSARVEAWLVSAYLRHWGVAEL